MSAGGKGTDDGKVRAVNEAGATVVERPAVIGVTMVEILGA